jgi:hypothetical protein
MAAGWLAEALGRPVPEVGFEELPQHRRPLMPLMLRRVIAATAVRKQLAPDGRA